MAAPKKGSSPTGSPTPDAVVADANAAIQKDNSGPERGKFITEGAANFGSLVDGLREATRQAQMTEARHA